MQKIYIVLLVLFITFVCCFHGDKYADENGSLPLSHFAFWLQTNIGGTNATSLKGPFLTLRMVVVSLAIPVSQSYMYIWRH